MKRSADGKTRVLLLSYGKDSMACLGAIELLDWPLDRIVTADVWATDTIRADLPPMVGFKDYADKVILERYGIEVEHYTAKNTCGVKSKKVTYEAGFYHELKRGKFIGTIKGFPITRQSGGWCKHLKFNAIEQSEKMAKGSVQYVGIAADEPNRFHNLTDMKLSSLVEIGWTEADCRAWCEKNDLLSPIYAQATRGGCWFCHNQSVEQLRLLRKDYPDLWALLLKWDIDSHVTFKADGHTVHDFDKRFALEDERLLRPGDRCFRWDMIESELNYMLF